MIERWEEVMQDVVSECCKSHEKRVFGIDSIDCCRQLINSKIHRLQLITVMEDLVVMVSSVNGDETIHEAR